MANNVYIAFINPFLNRRFLQCFRCLHDDTAKFCGGYAKILDIEA